MGFGAWFWGVVVGQVGFAGWWVGFWGQVCCVGAWGVVFGGWRVVLRLGGVVLGLREVGLGLCGVGLGVWFWGFADGTGQDRMGLRVGVSGFWA